MFEQNTRATLDFTAFNFRLFFYRWRDFNRVRRVHRSRKQRLFFFRIQMKLLSWRSPFWRVLLSFPVQLKIISVMPMKRQSWAGNGRVSRSSFRDAFYVSGWRSADRLSAVDGISGAETRSYGVAREAE